MGKAEPPKAARRVASAKRERRKIFFEGAWPKKFYFRFTKHRFRPFTAIVTRSRNDSEVNNNFCEFPLLSLTRKMAYISTSGSPNNLPKRYIAILDVLEQVPY
jgi:hypothetical protein